MSDSCDPHGLIAFQAPVSMGFPRQKCWSRLPFPSRGDLPNPGIEPKSPAFAGNLDNKEIKPVNPKGNQPWLVTGRTYVEAETPILWLPTVNSQLIGKDPDVGKDWGQEGKVVTEDEMVEWRLQLNGHEFEQTLKDGEKQGSLVSCSPWGYKESDMTEWVNNSYICRWVLYHRTTGVTPSYQWRYLMYLWPTFLFLIKFNVFVAYFSFSH